MMGKSARNQQNLLIIFLPVHWQTANLENHDINLLPSLWVNHQYSVEGQSVAIMMNLAR
jgi:hypothetical protein